MPLQVVGDVVHVKAEDGTVRLVTGDTVPSGVTDQRIAALVAAGLIAEVEPVEAVAEVTEVADPVEADTPKRNKARR